LPFFFAAYAAFAFVQIHYAGWNALKDIAMVNRLLLANTSTCRSGAVRLGLASALIAIASLAVAQTDSQRYAQARQLLQSGQPAAAAQAFRQLATEGDSASQFELSLLYRSGRGVGADPRASLKWLRRAAAGSYPAALSNLGGEYAKGSFVVQDRIRALALFFLAEAGGLREASTNAQVVARTMTREQQTQAHDLALRCQRGGPQACL
jgi:uncharacterized protein